MLYFKLYPFTLLRQCRSFTFLFMYLCELLQYYQSSNNLPQSAQTLDFDLKSCFVLLNTSSCSTRCWLASVSLFVALVFLGPRVTLLVVDLSSSQSLLLWFGLLRTSSRSARCSLVSVSLFVALVFLGPRVTLLVVDLSSSHSLYTLSTNYIMICKYDIYITFCAIVRVIFLKTIINESKISRV